MPSCGRIIDARVNRFPYSVFYEHAGEADGDLCRLSRLPRPGEARSAVAVIGRWVLYTVGSRSRRLRQRQPTSSFCFDHSASLLLRSVAQASSISGTWQPPLLLQSLALTLFAAAAETFAFVLSAAGMLTGHRADTLAAARSCRPLCPGLCSRSGRDRDARRFCERDALANATSPGARRGGFLPQPSMAAAGQAAEGGRRQLVEVASVEVERVHGRDYGG